MNMSMNKTPLVILMADDDEDDRLLTRDALQESKVLNELIFVENGMQLWYYLKGEGEYTDRAKFPLPGIILLDLNMPVMDGREVLKKIKSDSTLRRIPIVILTTSKAEEDKYRTYDLGAASYITKPVSFEALVELMRALGRYWIEFVDLPQPQ